jgi:uncharacterized protein YlxW (UPF0749 family)
MPPIATLRIIGWAILAVLLGLWAFITWEEHQAKIIAREQLKAEQSKREEVIAKNSLLQEQLRSQNQAVAALATTSAQLRRASNAALASLARQEVRTQAQVDKLMALEAAGNPGGKDCRDAEREIRKLLDAS